MRNKFELYKHLLLFFLIILIIVAPMPAYGELDYSTFDGEAVFVYELNSEEIIVNVNENELMYPGSLTKIMTVLVAAEYSDTSDVITITKDMLSLIQKDSSTAGLVENEIITFNNLVSAALIPSGNDAAIALAVFVGEKILGSGIYTYEDYYNAFISRMNFKARELGMLNTHFSNADGYYDDENYSTAYDLYLLTRKALECDIIINTVSKKSLSLTTNQKSHVWRSTNMMFFEDLSDFSYGMSGANPTYNPYVNGMKTGYTSKGKKCFIFTASNGEKNIIGIILHADNSDSKNIFNQAQMILNYIFEECSLYQLVNEDTRSYSYSVFNSSFFNLTRKLTCYMSNEDLILINNSDYDNITLEIELNNEIAEFKENGMIKLNSNIKKGDIIAYGKFMVNGNIIKIIPMISSRNFYRFFILDSLLIIIFIAFLVILIKHIKAAKKG